MQVFMYFHVFCISIRHQCFCINFEVLQSPYENGRSLSGIALEPGPVTFVLSIWHLFAIIFITAFILSTQNCLCY